METRTVQQVLIHKLIMNPMAGRTEDANLVAWSTDKNSLINWYNNELESEPYSDGNWHKAFKKESHLEWYNPIYDLEKLGHYGQGVQLEWVNEEFLPNIESRFLRII